MVIRNNMNESAVPSHGTDPSSRPHKVCRWDVEDLDDVPVEVRTKAEAVVTPMIETMMTRRAVVADKRNDKEARQEAQLSLKQVSPTLARIVSNLFRPPVRYRIPAIFATWLPDHELHSFVLSSKVLYITHTALAMIHL
jgi:hypothetical protein